MTIQLTYSVPAVYGDQDPFDCTVGPLSCQLQGATLSTAVRARDIEMARSVAEPLLFRAATPAPIQRWLQLMRRSGSINVTGRLPGSHVDTYTYGLVGDEWVYRWQFIRRFEQSGPESSGMACWVMLNPSASDVVSGSSRRTLQRVITETRAFDHRDITIVNLFSARATSASQLRKARQNGTDIVGTGTDESMAAAARDADRVILAWGSGGAIGRRGHQVAHRLSAAHPDLWCLGQGRSGQPFHPTAERSGRATLKRQPFRLELL